MLILSIFLLLCSNAVAYRRDKSISYGRSGMIILFMCFILTMNSLNISFLDHGIGLYHGILQTNAITHTFHIFMFLLSCIILQLNSFYPRKLLIQDHLLPHNLLFTKVLYGNSVILNKLSEQFRIIEYPLIILFVITGGLFLTCCFDLMSIFLAIELQSYGLYLLCSVYRDSEKATSAGLTYFLLGSLSSCFILLGSGLIYTNSGNTGFDGLYIVNNVSNMELESINNVKEMFFFLSKSDYINISLIIISIGFLFKVTAAPFHFWSPDVYDAIPTIVTTFVAIFAKISIFVFILELTHFTIDVSSIQNSETILQSTNTNFISNSWLSALLLSSLLSLIIGSILGLTQHRIKRLYAYSTISHVGFILFALAINSVESVQSFIFYIVQYSIVNLNAFVILICVGYSLYMYKQTDDNNYVSDKNNSPMQLISQMKGYSFVNPLLAISLGITIFSLIGIPPLIGFFAKQMILSSALDKGYIFISIVAIITSVISACYYLALIKQIFFDKEHYMVDESISNITMKYFIVNIINNKLLGYTMHTKTDDLYFTTKECKKVDTNNVVLSSSLTVTISMLTLIIVFFIINPQESLSISNILSLTFFNL